MGRDDDGMAIVSPQPAPLSTQSPLPPPLWCMYGSPSNNNNNMIIIRRGGCHEETQSSTHQHQQPQQSSASLLGSVVSGSIHSHIRELIERKQLREQHHQQQQRPAYHDQQHPPKQDDSNVIHGLHMDHVLNDQYYNGQYNNNKGTGNPYDDDFVKQHPPSVPFDQAAPLHSTAHPSPARSPLGPPYNEAQSVEIQ